MYDQRASLAKPSIESIQQQRVVIDYQLEVSKLKHEISTYQKHLQSLEHELQEQNRLRSKDDHTIRILEQELQSSNQSRRQLKEELYHTVTLLEQERRHKLDVMDEIAAKDEAMASLEESIRKRDEQRKEESHLTQRKRLEEEINKYRNEIQFKFAKKEKHYQQTIHKLQKDLGQDAQVFQQSSQSSNGRWVNKQVTEQDSPQLLKILELTYANTIEESVVNLQNIISELGSYQQLTLMLATKLKIRPTESPSSSMMQQLLETVKPDSKQRSTSSTKMKKFLEQLAYSLGVTDPDQVIQGVSEMQMELKGTQRIINNIKSYLQIPDQQSDLDLEQALYQRLGM